MKSATAGAKGRCLSFHSPRRRKRPIPNKLYSIRQQKQTFSSTTCVERNIRFLRRPGLAYISASIWSVPDHARVLGIQIPRHFIADHVRSHSAGWRRRASIPAQTSGDTCAAACLHARSNSTSSKYLISWRISMSESSSSSSERCRTSSQVS